MANLPYQGIEDLDAKQIEKLEHDAASEMAGRSVSASLSYLIAISVLYFSSSYPQDHPQFFHTALVIILLLQAVRVLLMYRFEQIYSYKPELWRKLAMTVISSSALVFACISAVAIYHYGNSWTAMAAIAITAGLCAGGLYSLCYNRLFVISYLTCLLVPNFIASLLAGGSSGYSLAILIAVFLFYFLMQSRHMHRSYWMAHINAIRLDNETKNKLHHLTYHDSVTGLPNRDLFEDRLQYEVHSANRRNSILAVLVLGLDRFSKINDTLGHHAGDQLLNAVAKRLKGILRENDTVSRFSSDVFTITLANLQATRDAARVADKIQNALNKPFEIAGIELFITTSIGISVYPTDSDSPESLFKDAEATMHRVKQHGGNAYQFFESSINTETMERLQMESKLRRALEKNEFKLFYQPKVDLKTSELSGFEALLRWCPDDGEPVSPLRFIPILEETGLIVPVGEWVLRTACLQAKVWQNMHYKQVRMAVNLSARQFRDQNLVELVDRVILETGLEAKWLELEITESMLMENSGRNFEVLHALSERGVCLSIDDFGTGYSSLAYIKRMPIKTVKIDRSFIKDITTDSNDAAVVQAIIAMAHNLRLQVVAEGTETAEQVKFLRTQGCDETQGFYFSRPLPANEIRTMFDTCCFVIHDADNDSKVTALSGAKTH